MKSQLYSLGIAGLLATCFVSFSAQANSGGYNGRSGKQGPTCMTACHGVSPSATAPEVTLTGPDTLPAGTSGSYTLTITGGPAAKGGMNVAVSDNGGTLSPAGSDVRLHSSGELIHSGAKDFSNNVVTFNFSLMAPSTAQTVTLYASGNSTNGNGNNNGDNAKSITKTVTITGGSTGTPDAGTGTPDAGSGKPDDGEDAEDDGGCSAAGGAPMVLLLALVAAHMRRRRD